MNLKGGDMMRICQIIMLLMMSTLTMAEQNQNPMINDIVMSPIGH